LRVACRQLMGQFDNHLALLHRRIVFHLAVEHDRPGAVAHGLDHPLGVADVEGLAAAWEITSRLPSARVVMLTVSRNDNDLFAALRAGASGYLLKDVDIDRLLEALDGVLLGEPAISKELVARLVSEFRDRSARRRSVLAPAPVDEPLTSREAPAPTPHRIAASAAASRTRGWSTRPR